MEMTAWSETNHRVGYPQAEISVNRDLTKVVSTISALRGGGLRMAFGTKNLRINHVKHTSNRKNNKKEDIITWNIF